MTSRLLCDPCVAHRGSEAYQFISSFFADPKRRVLLIAAGGFGPRSSFATRSLSSVAGSRTTAALIREERPNPQAELVVRAEENLNAMRAGLSSATIHRIEVFASDGVVIGGRSAVSAFKGYNLVAYTDIVVDLSALSVGVGFPMVRYLFERARIAPQNVNLHVTVVDNPDADTSIVGTPSDVVGTVHGFKGGVGLDQHSQGIRLWLPQFVANKNAVLEKIRSYVGPHEVCPILPFPAIDRGWQMT